MDIDEIPADVLAKLADVPACAHCGGRHARACPRVRRMAWHPNGELAEVEFWPDGRWSESHVIWPEALDAEDTEQEEAGNRTHD